MDAGLNAYYPSLGTQDTRKKLQLGADIVSYLSKPGSSVECEDLGAFIDGVIGWLGSSNFKVCSYGLEILGYFVDCMGQDFRVYLSAVLPATVDRLQDNKDQVREQAQSLIQKLIQPVSSPQYIIEKLIPSFSHKSWRVREEIMICLQKSLALHGSESMALNKVVPHIVKLLADPTAQVRDTAVITLVEIYRHVGERVRSDLQKKYAIPPSKLQGIMAKFDVIRDSGQMVAVSNMAGSAECAPYEDEVDRIATKLSSMSIKRANSAPPSRRPIFSAPKPPSSATAQAGAVDEETFIRSFEDVPKVQIYSGRDVEDILQKSRESLTDPNTDWEKRVETMKKLRGLLMAGATEYDELCPQLRNMVAAFQMSIKDLRSQVLREACITIAYLSQQLGNKMDYLSESLLPGLISLIPNSAKVMSTSGMVAIRFIIRYTHAPRLIPIITANMTSKSRDIRKECCEFLDQLLHTWPTHTLERHIAIVQEAIKKGLNDADSEARAVARKAFWGFMDHFPEQAESLMNTLDSNKQRMLQGHMGQGALSNSSSNNSLNSSIKVPRNRTGSSSASGSTENLSRVPSFSSKRSAIPLYSSPRNDILNGLRHTNGTLGVPHALRSNSAIDISAAQRARARATYAAAARLKVGSGASLPRSAKKPVTPVASCSSDRTAVSSPERHGRSRTRVGVSQSQPSSRSGSPSSRLSYATYSSQAPDAGLTGATRIRRRSGIAHSTGTSRETSPNRPLYSGHERRPSGGSLQKRTRSRSLVRGAERQPQLSTGKIMPVMAQRILTQSRAAEAALADALETQPEYSKKISPVRKRYDPFGNESDDSETSSVCSERSYSSFGRPTDDVAEIIANLASNHWADRKEGLVGLQNLVNSHRTLSATELKRVTDIFTKMFMDPHTKVFSIFLDTLNDLIITHKLDLDDWLYVLMTRLFNKLGADLLGSVQSKVQRTLETIRESFPVDQQFSVLMRFLIDQTQTPNAKVKVAVLNYLQVLSRMMSSSEFSLTPDNFAAINRIIIWTTDPKSAEIRKAAQTAVVALFSLNTPEFHKVLQQLPKNCQENITKMLNNHMRKNSMDDTPLKASPILMTTRSPNTSLTRPRPARNLEYDDTENLNPEEIYNSLRKTTAEIQNYSFDGIDHSFTKERKDRFDHDRDTTSQDSGISQMSVPDGRMDILEEGQESHSPTKRKEYNAALYQDKTHRNGYERPNFFETDMDLMPGDRSNDRPASIMSILAELGNTSHSARIDDRKGALAQLARLAREGTSSMWDDQFKSTLRVLLDILNDRDGSVRTMALRVLCELLRTQPNRFQLYAELAILKILDAHRDVEKEVVRTAEVCAGVLAAALPAEQSARVLAPIIQTGEYPVNLAAIKMLTKVIEQQTKPVIMQFVGEIMPGLTKAYDNPESSVRKAAVFCMVAAYLSVGDDLKPFLADLNGSKMKLLNLYIKRSQAPMTSSQPYSSSPTSPHHSSSSASSQDPSPRQ